MGTPGSGGGRREGADGGYGQDGHPRQEAYGQAPQERQHGPYGYTSVPRQVPPADPDPYAHLYRDEDADYTLYYAPNVYGGTGGDVTAEATGTFPVIDVDRAPRPGTRRKSRTQEKRADSVLGSSAVMALGTLVSRGTGFVRNMTIAAAIGQGTMGDSYQVAYTLPTMVYFLVGGGALNAVFVPQLIRSMKNDPDGGEAYANRLLTLVITALGAVVLVMVAAAPLLVRLLSPSLMSTPAGAHVTVSMARYCLPTIFFMGVHVVAGQILNSRERFGAMMWTPVLNNVVVIFTFGMYIWVFGSFGHSAVSPSSISPQGVRLLGVGTLLGLVVQALSMIPYLRASGLHFRPRFDWRGHGLGHAAKLARWTFLFVLANQAGLIVVTQLATAAEKSAAARGFASGTGLAAYTSAQTIWQLPQAVITVSVMSAVLPRISRAAADGDAAAVRSDISHGLRTSAVAIVPAAFLFLSLGPWIGALIYGTGANGGRSVGYMLAAFALGLIPYSAQYVMLRGFYAYEDTRTPFYNTVWIALVNAAVAGLSYLVLPPQRAVIGMAFGYGVAYFVGLMVALPRLRRRIGTLDGPRIRRTYGRLIVASLIPSVLSYLLARSTEGMLGGGLLGTAGALLVGLVVQVALFLALAKRMRIEELTALLGMVRGKLRR
ncbi:putative peptidoglycan lipid II flippase [Actinacidiphila yanglinensis]|uniref:Putative peptidoglycan lipid II flippase n=1 Tax=Actinacidiphila yanglinensis TaxID=310779 RepID=A0A1H5VS16_9ACTN|nr:murein biosynthesis integral membrane protein MurJ [Actinacidiphila yanglinensis]SEF89631.1 putative peptidoglycan lipid II flippase [Actinacidiphila yanglinensis]